MNTTQTAPPETEVKDALTLVIEARKTGRSTAQGFLRNLQFIEDQYGIKLSDMTALVFPNKARIRIAGGALN